MVRRRVAWAIVGAASNIWSRCICNGIWEDSEQDACFTTHAYYIIECWGTETKYALGISDKRSALKCTTLYICRTSMHSDSRHHFLHLTLPRAETPCLRTFWLRMSLRFRTSHGCGAFCSTYLYLTAYSESDRMMLHLQSKKVTVCCAKVSMTLHFPNVDGFLSHSHFMTSENLQFTNAIKRSMLKRVKLFRSDGEYSRFTVSYDVKCVIDFIKQKLIGMFTNRDVILAVHFVNSQSYFIETHSRHHSKGISTICQ